MPSGNPAYLWLSEHDSSMTVVYNPVLRQIGKQRKNADTPSQVLRVFLNSIVGSGTRSGAAHGRCGARSGAAHGRA